MNKDWIEWNWINIAILNIATFGLHNDEKREEENAEWFNNWMSLETELSEYRFIKSNQYRTWIKRIQK